MPPGLLDELGLGVASTRHNHGLQQEVLGLMLPDAVGRLVTVHDRHRTVHENKAVFEVVVLSIYYFVQGVTPVYCLVDDACDVQMGASCFDHDFKTD